MGLTLFKYKPTCKCCSDNNGKLKHGVYREFMDFNKDATIKKKNNFIVDNNLDDCCPNGYKREKYYCNKTTGK